MSDFQGIHEECGVFGLFSNNQTDAARMAYYGLYALQHRGQESCGIVVNHDGLFYSHKDLGLCSGDDAEASTGKDSGRTLQIWNDRRNEQSQLSAAGSQPHQGEVGTGA